MTTTIDHTTLSTGDFVVALSLDGLDIGQVEVEEDADGNETGVVSVAWEVGACRLSYPSGVPDVESFGSRREADAAFAERKALRDLRERVKDGEYVLVETMPSHLRESHDAAHNSGSYPDNGAERVLMHRNDADALLADDSDWSEIVRDARAKDVGVYEVRELS